MKGTNRPFFERALIHDVQRRLADCNAQVNKKAGKLVVSAYDPARTSEVIALLERVPGIANIAPAVVAQLSFEALVQAASQAVQSLNLVAPATFKVEARRSSKTFSHTSLEIARELGALLLKKYPLLSVDVRTPQLVVRVEVDHDAVYVSAQKHQGVGGLPMGSAGKVVALLSGGIDSPVAAWMMMRRGCEVLCVHFQNATGHTTGVQDKIEQLTRVLASHQGSIQTLVVPFADAQKKVVMRVKPELRMLVYRRLMLRIAERAAVVHGAQALITGDAVGQVASQTLENLAAVRHGIDMPVLSPLCGMLKDEIMNYARAIGTYDISTLPYDDCCSMFVPRHPATRARTHEVDRAEAQTALTSEEIDSLMHNATVLSA